MAITLKKFDPHAGPVKPFDCRVELLNDFLLEEDANIPNAKRRKSYPAVKIGRLAVSKDYEGQSFGRISLNYIKQTLLENRVSGCRFVTVDALKEAVGFYQKNGFQILATPEESDETVLMFYDLMKMKG